MAVKKQRTAWTIANAKSGHFEARTIKLELTCLITISDINSNKRRNWTSAWWCFLIQTFIISITTEYPKQLSNNLYKSVHFAYRTFETVTEHWCSDAVRQCWQNNANWKKAWNCMNSCEYQTWLFCFYSPQAPAPAYKNCYRSIAHMSKAHNKVSRKTIFKRIRGCKTQKKRLDKNWRSSA